MRVVLPILVLAIVGLVGCVTPEGAETPEFERTCPAFVKSPGTPQWRVDPWYHNASSENPQVAERNPRDKWIVTPTLIKANPYEYNDATLDFIDLEIHVETLVDASIWFIAYESAKGEPAAYNSSKMSREEFMETTGPQITFRDMNVQGRSYVNRIEFGPAYGNEPGDFVKDVGGNYRIEWTDGTGPFDPHNLRIDGLFRTNADGDTQTDSAVIFDIKATLWYRYHDCV